LRVACGGPQALFVVRGRRDMPGCSKAAPTLVQGFGVADDVMRDLARWCIGVNDRAGTG
jgi:hypothetical protein